MTEPLPPAVQWLEDLYDQADAGHARDPIGSPRDRAQAVYLARAARADTTGRTYGTDGDGPVASDQPAA